MSVKSTALTVGMVIAVAIIAVLISNHMTERRLDSLKLRPSYEQEKGSQPAQVEEKREDKMWPQPLAHGNREIEIKYSPEAVSDQAYDNASQGIEPTSEDSGWPEREAEMSSQGDPPLPKVASRPLPMFAPFHSDTGPLPQESDKTATGNLPEASEQPDYAGSSEPADPGSSPPRPPLSVEQPPEPTERYVDGGPPVSVDKKTALLPPFTPITNKTGPVPINNGR